MKQKEKPLLFRIIYRIIRTFYPRIKVEVKESLLPPGNIYVSNHAQLHGPLANYFYFPQKRYIWVTGQMCNRKEVTPYAMEDFWRLKSKWTKWIYKIFSILILAPLGSYLFKKADTIAVYKDVRLRKTLKDSMTKLNEGNDIIIFPEYRNDFNKFINDFQIHFVDVARGYTKKYQKDLYFYPMYTCASLKKVIIGIPIKYNPNAVMEEERARIVKYLQDEITRLGESLPNHMIVPYVNTKKKLRKKSKE